MTGPRLAAVESTAERELDLGRVPAIEGRSEKQIRLRGVDPCELGLGDAWLHADRLDDDMTRPANWLGDLVETHVAEGVETPRAYRSHRCPPRRQNFCKLGQSAGTTPCEPPADQVTSPT